MYVETFIPPDRLGMASLRTNLGKVESAISCAAREGARVASLGGFTSIILERSHRSVDTVGKVALTTGNSLTAGFIVRGVERAADRIGLDLTAASILIVGSTGDLGSACTAYFATRSRRLALCARRAERLRNQVNAISGARADVTAWSDPTEPLASADVVIAVASLTAPSLDLGRCKVGALVCDAGYPKNLASGPDRKRLHVFSGGMGQARRGWSNDSSVGESFYCFPAPAVAHGCMLEGMVLGLEQRYEPYSRGRGNITESRMTEILQMAERHGIVLAPLFDAGGLWPDEPDVA